MPLTYALGAILLALNFFFVLFTLCLERKNTALALRWILALIFLPGVGFLLYLLFGSNAVVRKKRILSEKKRRDRAFFLSVMRRVACGDGTWLRQKRCAVRDASPFLQLNRQLGNGMCTADNDVDIFITAKDKYRQLIQDIEAAERSVHMLYFIIRNDRIGRMIVELLAKKARAGVKVRLLYDYAGCMFTPAAMFRPLVESGAEVERFFPFGWYNSLKANLRNHRKLVIIDGRIGYIGGMNIGDEYMSLAEEALPWRDTHLRLTGSSVYLLQLHFLADWRFAADYQEKARLEPFEKLFPPLDKTGAVCVQIVSSGPDTEEEGIKWNFLKMIHGARRQICMQTPYFVPDESFMEALKIAASSGVRVVIMVPERTDNFVVHKVSLSYLGELLTYGVEVYCYPGFLHAKMLVSDDALVSIGSANMDMRSFALNFELNAMLYGAPLAKRCLDIFERDLRGARRLTLDDYRRRGRFERMQQELFRLLAPLF